MLPLGGPLLGEHCCIVAAHYGTVVVHCCIVAVRCYIVVVGNFVEEISAPLLQRK